MEVKTNCTHFNGYRPCKPHKLHGVHCEDCSYFEAVTSNILVIKLQAAGEVIRNTPLIGKLREAHPGTRLYWLTKFPEFVPETHVDKVLEFTPENLLLLQDIQFDALYSLDKDLEACAIANKVTAEIKKGFTQKNGVIVPFDNDSRRKWLTGVFDDLMMQTTHHYIEEIFEICGFSFSEEEYVLPPYNRPELAIDDNKTVVALNTGAGSLWKPRLYSIDRWTELSKLLLNDGYEVILLGGPEEDDRNKLIAEASGAKYFGTFSYRDFIGVVDLADLVVSAVTLAFHIAVGLKKQVVLLNNIFNRAEFYLYGRGVILEPDLPCLMCYKNDFDVNCRITNCMDLIQADSIAEKVNELVQAS